jgi:hypothetical protein
MFTCFVTLLYLRCLTLDLFLFLMFVWRNIQLKVYVNISGSSALPDCSKDSVYPFVCWQLQIERHICFVMTVAWGSLPEGAAIVWSVTCEYTLPSYVTLCRKLLWKFLLRCNMLMVSGDTDVGGVSIMCCYRATKCQVLCQVFIFKYVFPCETSGKWDAPYFSMVLAEVLYLSKFFYEFWSDVTQKFSKNRTSLSFRHTHREDNVITFLGMKLVNTAMHKRGHLLETHYNICLL